MNNSTYDYCQLEMNQDSTFCQIVNLEGELPQNLEFVYSVSYIIYFVLILAVIFSPVYFVYKLIGGLKHD